MKKIILPLIALWLAVSSCWDAWTHNRELNNEKLVIELEKELLELMQNFAKVLPCDEIRKDYCTSRFTSSHPQGGGLLTYFDGDITLGTDLWDDKSHLEIDYNDQNQLELSNTFTTEDTDWETYLETLIFTDNFENGNPNGFDEMRSTKISLTIESDGNGNWISSTVSKRRSFFANKTREEIFGIIVWFLKQDKVILENVVLNNK